MFPVLGNENELVKRALTEHRKLRKLFERVNEEEKNLGLIEEKLDAHIRFEERILFNEIQNVATPSELEEVMAMHSDHATPPDTQEWEDQFWL